MTYKEAIECLQPVADNTSLCRYGAALTAAIYAMHQMERLTELEQADKEGRLLVLPCKVGDTVWAIRNYRGRKVPQKSIVSEMYFLPDMTLSIVCKYVARGQFGKTVFLTREEAEAALKGEGNG